MEPKNQESTIETQSCKGGVVCSDFLKIKQAEKLFSIACKKYVESKPYQDMIKALKGAGAF